ncbi:MAG TPA: hypothetical protein DCZ10_11465 [Pelotomaculum sp.]|nr:hypothetical protein [Pelotomaculum sp.]
MSDVKEACPLQVKTNPVQMRSGFWIFSGLSLFCLCFWLSITEGFNMADTSWFLQVVHRVTSGEVLYRDVFFGATPFSIYLTAIFTALFGTEILVVKEITALCLVLTVLVSCRIVQALGFHQGFPYLLVLALIVYAPPEVAVYQPLANLFFLICFYAALVWTKSGKAVNRAGKGKSTGALAAAGLAAGLCFVSKQNIGIYALGALLLVVACNSSSIRLKRQRKPADLLLVLAAFFLVSALVFLPVWFSGGIEKLLDYGFFNKGTYIRLGRVSYLDGLSQLAVLLGNIGSFDNLKTIYLLAPFLLPFLTFGALLAAWLHPSVDKRMTTTVVLFVGAAFLGIFPRAGRTHLTFVIPELLIGLAYAWFLVKPHLTARWVRLIQAGPVLWFGTGLAFMLMNPLVKVSTADYQISNLPHFRGVFMNTDKLKEIHSFAQSLTEEVASNERAFILSPYAGFYYLVSGLKNPTSFDYPLATAFGRNGESEVIAAISRREIDTVFLGPQLNEPSLHPVLLAGYIQGHMKRERDWGGFIIYRLAAP